MRLLRFSRFGFFITLVVLPSGVFWEVLPRHVGMLEPQYRSLLLYLSDIPLLFAVASWTVSHLLSPDRPLRLGPYYIAIPALALVLLSALSPLWAYAVPIATETAARTLVLFALYLMVVNDPSLQPLLKAGLVATVVIQAPVALIQFLTQGPVGLQSLGEIVWYETTPGAWLRGYGLSPHPNILGGFLALGLIALVGLKTAKVDQLDASSQGEQSSVFSLIVFSGALAIGTAGLLSTFSRSAWLGFLGGVLYFIAYLVRQTGMRAASTRLLSCLLPLALVAGIFIALYPYLFITRLILPTASVVLGDPLPGSELEMGVLEQRNQLHEGAIHLITAHPLLGVGAGNYSIAYYEQRGRNDPFRFYQPEHNVPILLTAELGLVAGIAWLLMTTAPLVSTIKSRVGQMNSLPGLWAAAILIVLLISQFDFYFWERQQGRVLFWALLGAWVNSRSNEAQTRLQGENPIPSTRPSASPAHR